MSGSRLGLDVYQRLVDVLTLLALWILHGGTMEHGSAPRYRAGLMEAVADERGLPPAPCMVSRIEDEIGRWVIVEGNGTALACRVVDTSQPAHRARHRAKGYVVEIAAENARALCGSVIEPPRMCPVKVWGL